MKNWAPVSVVILILTTVLGLTMLLACVAPLITGERLTPDDAQMLNGIYKSVIAIITLYVGAMIQKNKDDKK